MKIIDVKAYPVSIPLVPPVSPYGLSRTEVTASSTLIVEVDTDESIVGWGETRILFSAKVDEFMIREYFKPILINKDPFNVEKLVKSFQYRGLHHRANSMIAGIEMALWDIMGKDVNKPLYKLLGGKLREKIPIAACMGIRRAKEAAETAAEYANQGFSTIKTKGGRSISDDVARVKAIRKAVGGDVEIRLDANQAYSPGSAMRLIKKVEKYDLQYFEQPCRWDSLEEMAKLRASTETPIALNESVTDARSMLNIVEAKAADFCLPDMPDAGGIIGVKKIAAVAEAAGIPLIMHCFFEKGIKTAASLHVVSSTPIFNLANDSTIYGHKDYILKEPFKVLDGCIEVPEGPGLGIEVDGEKLKKYSTPIERVVGIKGKPEWQLVPPVL